MTGERFVDCIESLARACGLATNEMGKTDYKEILRLAKMLSDADIPYQISELHGGYHITYPSDDSECVCSVVEHSFSYGAENDLLEIMGLLTEQGKAEDVCDDSAVKGHLSAENVFERISEHYADNYKNGRTTA